MKKITIFAKSGDSNNIEVALKDLVYYREIVENAVKYVIYVPDSIVNDIVEKLRNSIDLRYKESSIAVESQDFVISSYLKRIDKKNNTERPPVEKLISSVKKYSRFDVLYVILTGIAGLIAMTGLFLNNVAVVIGAMLLSPLLGPIYSFAINIAVGKAKDGFRSITNLIISLTLVILLSYVLTIILSFFTNVHLTKEMLVRFDTNPIYLLMASLLGFASVLALYKGISESIAGIAIAAALLPPAVVTGIAIYLTPESSIYPLMMTIENLLGLMMGALIAVPILGIGPRYYYELEKAKKYTLRVALVLITLFIAILIIAYFLH